MVVTLLILYIFWKIFRKDIQRMAKDFQVDRRLPYRFITRIRDRKKLLEWEYEYECVQATYFHCDLGDMLVDMLNSPYTTSADWRAILPVCRYADAWFAKTHPHITNFAKREEFVKQIMA